MGLAFVNSSDIVNFGSNAALDLLTNATILVWFNANGSPDAATERRLWAKPDSTKDLYLDTTANTIHLEVARNTTSLQAITTTGITTGIPQFIAGVYNTGGVNTDQHVYLGNRATPPRELAYSTQAVGTGTVSSDASGSCYVGNRNGGFRVFGGEIYFVGVWNRCLSAREISELYLNLRPTPGCVLFSHLGWADALKQNDLSGWGNYGVITGATRVPHPPWLNGSVGYRQRKRLWISVSSSGFSITPDGKASGTVYGSPQQRILQSVSGRASTLATGSPTGRINLSLSGRSATNSYGSLQARVVVTPTAKSSSTAYGTSTERIVISTSGVAASESYGAIQAKIGISETGRGADAAVGTPLYRVTMALVGNAASEAFGTLQNRISPTPTGIASSEAFGTGQLRIIVTPDGKPSSLAFGISTFTYGQAAIYPTGLASQTAYGAVGLSLRMAISGRAASEAFGSPTSMVRVQPSPRSALGLYGNPACRITLLPTGKPSSLSMGAVSTRVAASPSGLLISSSFGSQVVRLRMALSGNAASERFGVFTFTYPGSVVPFIVIKGLTVETSDFTAQIGLDEYKAVSGETVDFSEEDTVGV